VFNADLQKKSVGQPIEVHEGREIIDQSNGIDAAHARARTIGQSLNAKLVIWGRKVGDKTFNPRITVVNAPKTWTEKSERTDQPQTITDLRVPEELTDEPFYLIHFAAGYTYYDQKNYRKRCHISRPRYSVMPVHPTKLPTCSTSPEIVITR
jgi:hypothetical protein